MSAFNWITVVALPLTLALGVALLWRGLRGRRVGTEPHCRQCRYNLTGSASDICPECGADTAQTGVLIGSRQRHRLACVSGLLILLMSAPYAGFVGYTQLKTINLYRYYPLGWVLKDARAATASALQELVDRYQRGGLSVAQVDRVADEALRQQAAAVANPLTQPWIDLLERIHSAGDLRGTRTRAYADHLLTYRLGIRPQVRLGDRITVQSISDGRTPSSGGWEINVRTLRLAIGPTAIAPGETGCINGGCTVGCTFTCGNAWDLPEMEPGVYPVTYVLEAAAHPDHDLTIDYRRTVTVTGSVQVLPANAPDDVALVHDPSMAERIRSSIAIQHPSIATLAGTTPGSTHERKTVTFTLTVGIGPFPAARLPMNVAFDVVAVLDGREFNTGPIVAKPNVASAQSRTVAVDQLLDPHLSVYLRPNPDAARATTDIFEIWDGTVVYEQLEIKHGVN